MLSTLWKGRFGGLPGSLTAILEEVAELCGGAFFEQSAFDEEGVIEAFVGGDVVEGSGVSGFRIRGRVDQARETARVGGARAHGARLQGGVEGATGQAPAACGGGCATNGEEFSVCGWVPGSFALVGGDGQDLPSPGNDSPDRNL